jgi:hypothetical protein
MDVNSTVCVFLCLLSSAPAVHLSLKASNYKFLFITMYTLEPTITRSHDFRIHTLCVVTVLVRSLSGCLSVVFLDVTVQLAAYTVGQPGERNRTVCFAEGSCRS